MLLIATRNQGKLIEYQSLLKKIPQKIISLDNLPSIDKSYDVSETGETYKQNAILKAKTYGQKANILTMADDSGLEIDALQGQLGVHSSRFAQDNFKTACFKILKSLKDLPKTKRTAKFVCVIALYNPQTKTTKTFTGQSSGLITTKPQGGYGFGYDPIFYSLDLKKTYAQSTNQEKNQISQRAKAATKLIKHLMVLSHHGR